MYSRAKSVLRGGLILHQLAPVEANVRVFCKTCLKYAAHVVVVGPLTELQRPDVVEEVKQLFWKAFAKFLGRSVSFELTNLGVFLHLDL